MNATFLLPTVECDARKDDAIAICSQNCMVTAKAVCEPAFPSCSEVSEYVSALFGHASVRPARAAPRRRLLSPIRSIGAPLSHHQISMPENGTEYPRK